MYKSFHLMLLFPTLIENVYNNFAKERSKANIVKWKDDDEGWFLQKFVL